MSGYLALNFLRKPPSKSASTPSMSTSTRRARLEPAVGLSPLPSPARGPQRRGRRCKKLLSRIMVAAGTEGISGEGRGGEGRGGCPLFQARTLQAEGRCGRDARGTQRGAEGLQGGCGGDAETCPRPTASSPSIPPLQRARSRQGQERRQGRQQQRGWGERGPPGARPDPAVQSPVPLPGA